MEPPVPTLAEIGQDYAYRVAMAVATDREAGKSYTEGPGERIVKAASLRASNILTELKKIAREVDSVWEVENKPLTPAHKREIYRSAGRSLALDDPDDFERIVKGGSNEELSSLVVLLTNLVRPNSGRK